MFENKIYTMYGDVKNIIQSYLFSNYKHKIEINKLEHVICYNRNK
jgi:hypothetical protein